MYSNITIIIPIYNEKENIDLLLSDINTNYRDINILVIDDGSSDGIIEFLKGNNIENFNFLSNKINKGLTYSIIKGISNCKTDFFIVMDGDFQHPISNIKDFIKFFNKGSDIVVGNRKKILFKNNICRKYVSYLGNFIIKYKLKNHDLNINDPLSGFFGGKTILFQKFILNNTNMFLIGGYKFLFDILKVIDLEKYIISNFNFTFGFRKYGVSKLGFREYYNFIKGIIK